MEPNSSSTRYSSRLQRQFSSYDLSSTFAPIEQAPVAGSMGPPPPKRRKLEETQKPPLPIQPDTQLSSIVAQSLTQNNYRFPLNLVQHYHKLIDNGQFASYLKTGVIDSSTPPDPQETVDDRLLKVTKRAIKIIDVGLYRAVCTFLNEQEAPFRYYQDFVENSKRSPEMQDLLERTFDHSLLCTQERVIRFREKNVATIYINDGMQKSSYPLLSVLDDFSQLEYMEDSPQLDASGNVPGIEFKTENLKIFLAVLKLLHCGKIQITRSNFQRLFLIHRYLKEARLEYRLLGQKLLEWVLNEKDYFTCHLDNLLLLLDALFVPRSSLNESQFDQISVLLPENLANETLTLLLQRYQQEDFGLFVLKRFISKSSQSKVILEWFREHTNLLNKKLWLILSSQFGNSATADIFITTSETQGVATQSPGHLSVLALSSGFFRTYRDTGFTKKNSLKMFEVLTSSEKPETHELPYNSFAASKVLEFCYRGPLTVAFLEECLHHPHADDNIPFLILSYADILAIDSFKDKLIHMIDEAFSSEERDLLDVRNSLPLSIGSNGSDSLGSPSVSYRSRNLLRSWLPAVLSFKPQFQRTDTIKRLIEFVLEDLKKLSEPELRALINHPFIDFLKEHSSYLNHILIPKDSPLTFLQYLLEVFTDIDRVQLQKPCERLYEYMKKLDGWKEISVPKKHLFFEVIFVKAPSIPK